MLELTAVGQTSSVVATWEFTDSSTAPTIVPAGGFAIDGGLQANTPTVGIGIGSQAQPAPVDSCWTSQEIQSIPCPRLRLLVRCQVDKGLIGFPASPTRIHRRRLGLGSNPQFPTVGVLA